jgi:hypothetical protein
MNRKAVTKAPTTTEANVRPFAERTPVAFNRMSRRRERTEPTQNNKKTQRADHTEEGGLAI